MPGLVCTQNYAKPSALTMQSLDISGCRCKNIQNIFLMLFPAVSLSLLTNQLRGELYQYYFSQCNSNKVCFPELLLIFKEGFYNSLGS